MSFTVTIKPSNHSFTVEPDETILEAGIRHGYTMPYSCRDGVCGACKGDILEGVVDYGEYQPFALTPAEKAAGGALFCKAKPLSDLVIEGHEITSDKEIPVKTLPTRVQKMVRLTEDVMVLYLKLPANERLQFLAGQYVDIQLKDDKPRSFSLANAPHDDEFLELHIRNIPGGAFTRHVFNGMKERDILRIKGPLGGFYLREDSDKPILFVASGTGFAPVKAIVEHALQIGVTRPMHIYWGVRRQSDFYMLDKVQEWQAKGVKFTAVVSDEPWAGRSGFVHQAVLEDYADLSGYQVYACGAPVVVEAAHRDFTSQRGLPQEEFFSDAFSFAPKNGTPAAA
ncbi:MAG TPA: CDP-6-deoxy-delta-3,4-glucoseen reductase [Gallionellaceae bacterium]|nr:CDP-6-deoxy-delta-3,4-glucoseen reductase [Gallionellaceae bacterium]